MQSLIFELIQSEQPTKDVTPIISTFTDARVVEGEREKTAGQINKLLEANRLKTGFDAVALMNNANQEGEAIEQIILDFIPWCHEHGALYMVAGSYMDLLEMITEPLAD